jgi:hypothetical protein
VAKKLLGTTRDPGWMFRRLRDQKGKLPVNLDDNVHVQSSFEGFGDPTKQLERSPAISGSFRRVLSQGHGRGASIESSGGTGAVAKRIHG